MRNSFPAPCSKPITLVYPGAGPGLRMLANMPGWFCRSLRCGTFLGPRFLRLDQWSGLSPSQASQVPSLPTGNPTYSWVLPLPTFLLSTPKSPIKNVDGLSGLPIVWVDLVPFLSAPMGKLRLGMKESPGGRKVREEPHSPYLYNKKILQRETPKPQIS